MTNPLVSLVSHTFLVYCPKEAEAVDGAGFWSKVDGWVPLARASLFTEVDKDNLHLTMGDGASWMRSPTAARRCLITAVMDALRGDGFEVIPGPSGGWSWATAQAGGPDDDAFASQGEAWAALANERHLYLAASGLSIEGLFEEDADRYIVPQYMARAIDGALWTVHDSGMPAVVLLSLEDILSEAQDYLRDLAEAVSDGRFEGAPTHEDIEFVSDLGDVITMVEALAMYPGAEMQCEPQAREGLC